MSLTIIYWFLPWFIFDWLPKSTSHQITLALFFALGTTIIGNYKGLKKLFVIPWVSLAFFSVLLILTQFLEINFILQHIWVASNTLFTLVVIGSLIIRRPFTLAYAKEIVAKDKWDHPIFIKINNYLTMVWGLVFITNLLINLYRDQLDYSLGALASIMTYLTTIFGIWFCSWFPKWYSKYLTSKKLNSTQIENQI